MGKLETKRNQSKANHRAQCPAAFMAARCALISAKAEYPKISKAKEKIQEEKPETQKGKNETKRNNPGVYPELLRPPTARSSQPQLKPKNIKSKESYQKQIISVRPETQRWKTCHQKQQFKGKFVVFSFPQILSMLISPKAETQEQR